MTVAYLADDLAVWLVEGGLATLTGVLVAIGMLTMAIVISVYALAGSLT